MTATMSIQFLSDRGDMTGLKNVNVDPKMDTSRDSPPTNDLQFGSVTTRTPSANELQFDGVTTRTPSPMPDVDPSPPVPNDPRNWSRNDVSRWLQWATIFYQLDAIDLSKFAMNGRGLCLMTRQGFTERAPTCGDVLCSDFQRRVVVAIMQSRPSSSAHGHLSSSSSASSASPQM